MYKSLDKFGQFKIFNCIAALFFVFTDFNADAQDFNLDWAFGIDASIARVEDMAMDDSGNVYIVGTFTGTTDFNPGPGIFYLAGSSEHTFVAKYNNDGQFIWAHEFTSASTNRGYFIGLDSLANIYVGGHLFGTADFDTGGSIYNLTSVGQSDIYICKLNNSGNFLWAKSFGSTQIDELGDLHVTPGGKVVHTGFFSLTVDLDPGPGTQIVSSFGGLDIYIQVLQTNGSLHWAHQIGGGEWDYGDAIVIDTTGNVYVGCRYWWPVDFDPGPGDATLGGTQYGSCVVKFDQAGNFIWVKDLGMFTDVDDLCMDSFNNLIISGTFYDTIDFDFGPALFNVIPDGSSDRYFGKYTSDGDLIWIRNFIGPGTPIVEDMFLDSDDRIYFYGGFSGATDFDPGIDTFLLDAAPMWDGSIIKLESNGDFINSVHIGNSSGSVSFQCAAVDQNLNVFAGGYFYHTTDFDPGGGVFAITGTVNEDGFLLKFGPCNAPPDPPGDLNPDHINICSGESTTLYSTHIGTLSYYTESVGGSFIASDNSFTTPILYNTTTYYVQDSTCAASTNRTAVTVTVFDLPDISINANPDFDLCADESLTLSGSGGITYSWNLGVTNGISFMPVDSTIFIVQGTDANGCVNSDTALITVHDPVISFIALNNTTLNALTIGDSYQWFDCLAGFTPVVGATDSTFSPTENGYYALQVTIDGCSDMSSCYQILSLTNSENLDVPFTIYPNPTDGYMYVDFLITGTIEIFDINGKSVFQKTMTDSDVMIDISNLPTGVYTLIFDSDGKRYYSKIVRV